MSLFKTRELWSVSHPPNETYTARHLCFLPSENLVTSKFKADLILSASLEGTLRLFHVILQAPQEAEDEEEVAPEHNSAHHDLLLETNLQLPILQVAVGNFSRYVYLSKSWYLFKQT